MQGNSWQVLFDNSGIIDIITSMIIMEYLHKVSTYYIIGMIGWPYNLSYPYMA
jgi:hypothetical protein